MELQITRKCIDKRVLLLRIVCKSGVPSAAGSAVRPGARTEEQPMASWIPQRLSRRGMLSGGILAAGGAAVATRRHAAAQTIHTSHDPPGVAAGAHRTHGHMITVGDVDNAKNGFDPAAILTDWDTGTVSRLPDGRTLRTFEVVGAGQGDRDRTGPASSRHGPTTGASPVRRFGPPRAIVCASCSRTMDRIRTRCTSMASIPPAWTACPAPASSARARNSSTSSTPCRSAATSIIATRCR